MGEEMNKYHWRGISKAHFGRIQTGDGAFASLPRTRRRGVFAACEHARQGADRRGIVFERLAPIYTRLRDGVQQDISFGQSEPIAKRPVRCKHTGIHPKGLIATICGCPDVGPAWEACVQP